jgi:multidrug resistance efflux pump
MIARGGITVLLAAILAATGCDDQGLPSSKDKKDGVAEKSSTPPAKEAASKGPTHKVEKGPLKIEVTLKGVVEAEDSAEVVLRPEAWTNLSVLKAVEHGASVHKGDPLVTLDFEKIDQAIHDLEAERALAEIALQLAGDELPLLEKTTPDELAAAERANRIAVEDLKHFNEIDKEESVKQAEFMVKNSKNVLEYVKEELKQLEKMYRANDLREETEEIILKRQRDQVESAQFRLHSTELLRDHTLKFDLPRREQNLKDAVEKQGLALEKAKSSLPLTLQQKKLALAKLKSDQEKSLEKLQKLQKDRAAMALRAPCDGIVYYGRCVRGQWTPASTLAAKLQRGGSLQADEVFITIVQPRPIFVRAAVEEKELENVRAGMNAKVIPVSFPETKLAGKVAQVGAIPLAPGSFEAKVTLDPGKDLPGLMPGMDCSVKIVTYAKADAVTVPSAAVFAEEMDEDKHFVYVPGKNGKNEKRSVTIGKKTGTKTEILTGLQPGDEIVLEKS